MCKGLEDFDSDTGQQSELFWPGDVYFTKNAE